MDIQYSVVDKKMFIQLPQRVESDSILEFEKELYCIINRGTNYKTIFDASNMEYISISGLRVLMKLRLEFGNFKLINTKPEVQKILKENGFSELFV